MFPETPVTRMFPSCFPVLPHGKHCFQRQFCFQEAKFASATRQKHFVSPRGMEAWQNEETIRETGFWKHCFQRQFCFQEAKFASATRQKHIRVSARHGSMAKRGNNYENTFPRFAGRQLGEDVFLLPRYDDSV